jgi:GntR family transcriptional regulator
MLISLDKHGGIPIYRQVMDQLKEQIMTGRLEEGTQLESVAVLSARLKVNPMTISKAYASMVQDGLLERRAGVGVFVNRIKNDTRNREKNAMLAEALGWVVSLAQQMEMSEQEVAKLLTEHYRKAARRQKDE